MRIIPLHWSSSLRSLYKAVWNPTLTQKSPEIEPDLGNRPFVLGMPLRLHGFLCLKFGAVDLKLPRRFTLFPHSTLGAKMKRNQHIVLQPPALQRCVAKHFLPRRRQKTQCFVGVRVAMGATVQ